MQNAKMERVILWLFMTFEDILDVIFTAQLAVLCHNFIASYMYIYLTFEDISLVFTARVVLFYFQQQQKRTDSILGYNL